MRNALKVLFVVALAIPTMAFADLNTSKHNLTAAGSGTVKTNATVAACKFCHLVHNSSTQRALWSRIAPTSTVGYAAGNTIQGTVLPIAQNTATQQCMSCHDGSVAMNQVTTKQGVVRTWGTFTASTSVTAGGLLLAGSNAFFGAGLAGQHPVQIAYAGQGAGSAVTNLTGQYQPATATGCIGTTVCVSGATTEGTKIKLYGTLGTATIECGSCHDVHSDANSFFLRVAAPANYCIACHIQ
jgi:predicted CXXCH cytochrome family protein